MGGHFEIYDPPDPLAKLPALAERLGVKEYISDDEVDRTLLSTKDGRSYDLFDLINAVLDKIDGKI